MSPLERDQLDIALRLAADPYFVDVGIYLVRPRENLDATQIIESIEQSLNCLTLKNGKGGVAVQVLMPLGGVPSPNAPGPQLQVTITVRVQEFALMNMGSTGTFKSAEEIAIKVAKILHHYNTGSGGVFSADNNLLKPSIEYAPKITYDVTLGRLMQLTKEVKVATPTIAPKSGEAPLEITLSCLTDGAAIYYTTDGTYPCSANPSALLYAAPFTLADSGTLRVGAEADGLQLSDVASAVFTGTSSFSAPRGYFSGFF